MVRKKSDLTERAEYERLARKLLKRAREQFEKRPCATATLELQLAELEVEIGACKRPMTRELAARRDDLMEKWRAAAKRELEQMEEEVHIEAQGLELERNLMSLTAGLLGSHFDLLGRYVAELRAGAKSTFRLKMLRR